MGLLSRQLWCLATVLIVPLLTLASPAPLRLAGIAPAWAILWLLPWALVDGPLSGLLAGAAVGLLLDALQPAAVAQWPALMLLGLWWGRLGRSGPTMDHSFGLGLLAMLGCLLLDLSLMLQWLLASSLGRAEGRIGAVGIDAASLAQPGWHLSELGQAGLHVLLARILITGLLAPVLCSLQLLFWRQLLGGGWRR
jgi:hypothetical protein